MTRPPIWTAGKGPTTSTVFETLVTGMTRNDPSDADDAGLIRNVLRARGIDGNGRKATKPSKSMRFSATCGNSENGQLRHVARAGVFGPKTKPYFENTDSIFL